MHNLLSMAFWLNSRPEIIGDSGKKILVAIAAILVIIAIIVTIKAYPHKWSIYRPTLQKLVPFSYINATIALYFIFLNDQIIPVLRARYWYLIWLAIVSIWIFSTIKDLRKRAKRKQELANDLEKQKYLPK